MKDSMKSYLQPLATAILGIPHTTATDNDEALDRAQELMLTTNISCAEAVRCLQICTRGQPKPY